MKDSFLATYRARLFELLAETGENQYFVFHGDPPRRSAQRAAEPPFAFDDQFVGGFEIPGAGGSIIWQAAVRPILRGGFDAVVLGSEMRLLANVALFLELRRRGVPVVLWGQGGPKGKRAGPVLRAIRRSSWSLKWAAARRADGFLAYTEQAKRALTGAGVQPDRVFVLGNTIDVDAEARLRVELATADPAALRAELGLMPDSAVLLYIGRVYREKRVEDLVRVVRERRSDSPGGRALEAVVIGEGPALEAVKREAGEEEGIHFRGEIREPATVAQYMRVADAVVIPGAVGLAVNHAFAHGVPVVTQAGDLHGPEFEYLVDGENGLVAGQSVADLGQAIERVVRDPELRDRLAAGALASADGLGLAQMARRFDEGVTATLARAAGRA